MSAAGGSASTTSSRTYDDFRFVPAFKHVLVYTCVWLAALMVFVGRPRAPPPRPREPRLGVLPVPLLHPRCARRLGGSPGLAVHARPVASAPSRSCCTTSWEQQYVRVEQRRTAALCRDSTTSQTLRLYFPYCRHGGSGPDDAGMEYIASDCGIWYRRFRLPCSSMFCFSCRDRWLSRIDAGRCPELPLVAAVTSYTFYFIHRGYVGPRTRSRLPEAV